VSDKVNGADPDEELKESPHDEVPTPLANVDAEENVTPDTEVPREPLPTSAHDDDA
jgi:hypothetical protein